MGGKLLSQTVCQLLKRRLPIGKFKIIHWSSGYNSPISLEIRVQSLFHLYALKQFYPRES